MTQTTRPDVHPLCDKHPVAYMERDTGDLHHCTAGSCTRHYDTIRGYFDVIDGTPVEDKMGKVPCPEDESAMYLQAYDPRSGIGVWRCALIGCGQQKPFAAA